MRILFVEDNEGFARDLESVLSEIPGIDQIIRVITKDEAYLRLQDDLIDLVILDLSIPPSRETIAPDPEHGQYLFHEAQSLRPGTPIFILTGAEVEKFSRSLARYGNQIPLWGNNTNIETVNFFLKEEVDQIVERIRELAAIFNRMNAVAINTRGKDIGLSPVQSQMIKCFANKADGVACDVTLLSGGLSGAKVVKVAAMDSRRNTQVLCAGKLGPASMILSELNAYEQHARKLGIGACPPLYHCVKNGVGSNGAIFYTLTDDDTESLFDRLAAHPSIGAAVVPRVRDGLRRWSEAATADLVEISEIRRRLVSDEDAAEIEAKFSLSKIREIEARSVQASQSCIHGDLHCGNVLVKGDGGAVLIDFGDAGPGFTALDPITMELSLIFHPDAASNEHQESLLKKLPDWPNLDRFSPPAPLKPMFEACREWAHDVGGGDQAVLSSAYAYTLRQLKYETVDPTVTISLLSELSRLIAKF